MAHLKLGTRKSLLALAQSRWVARLLMEMHPGLHIELVGIETRGDRLLDRPLSQLEGKDFFVAEIDHALRCHQVDFAVHSMKDLSIARPPELCCAAIPQRENPRDVIIWSPASFRRAQQGVCLRLGTSSPRRLANLELFLKQALPCGVHFEWVQIRGNVHTRLARLHELEHSQRYLDGVVLAIAGLIRLWSDEEASQKLKPLLKSIRWMVLPIQDCPTAPGQGALSLECRSDDEGTRRWLLPLHHERTALHVKRERELLMEWGGGCHQRLGATVIPFEADHTEQKEDEIFYIRGITSEGVPIQECRWQYPRAVGPNIRAWDGTQMKSTMIPLRNHENLRHEISKMGQKLMITHVRAFQGVQDFLSPQSLSSVRVWVPGVTTWFHLASLGVWVEGCAENQGFKKLKENFVPLLDQGRSSDWMLWTHEQAALRWQAQGLDATAIYRSQPNASLEQLETLKVATHVFWSSGSQYLEYRSCMTSKQVHQSCGAGGTAEILRQQGESVCVFPSVKEWQQWLKSSP